MSLTRNNPVTQRSGFSAIAEDMPLYEIHLMMTGSGPKKLVVFEFRFGYSLRTFGAFRSPISRKLQCFGSMSENLLKRQIFLGEGRSSLWEPQEC